MSSFSPASAPLLRRDSQSLTETSPRNPDFGTFSTSLGPLLVPPTDLVIARIPNRSPPAGPKHPDGSEDGASSDRIQDQDNLGFIETCKLYPAAIGWSAFVSLGIIMLAFDPQLMGNLYATPQFRKDFGYLYNGDVGVLFSLPKQCSLLIGIVHHQRPVADGPVHGKSRRPGSRCPRRRLPHGAIREKVDIQCLRAVDYRSHLHSGLCPVARGPPGW